MRMKQLQDYIVRADLKDGEFALKVGVSRGYITQLRLGLRKQPSLKVALAIERATRGKVPAKAWGIA